MQLDVTASAGTPLLAALENFYADNIEGLARRARRTFGASPTRIASELKPQEFLRIYLEQLRSRDPQDWFSSIESSESQLRASLVGRELIAATPEQRRLLRSDGAAYSAGALPGVRAITTAEVKAAACYAHDMVIEDPFDLEQDVAGLIRDAASWRGDEYEIAVDPDVFTRTIERLAELEPLIQRGVVKFVPRRISMSPHLDNVYASPVLINEEQRRRQLAERTMRMWLLSGGRVASLFESDLDQTAFESAAGLFGGELNNTEWLRLRQLATLALPSAPSLRIKDIVDVRTSDAFTQLRVTQQGAVAGVGDHPNDDDAERYREHMRAAAAALRDRPGSGVLARALIPGSITWGVGAVLIQAADPRVLFASIAGASVGALSEVWRSRLSSRALRDHYTVLGQTSAHKAIAQR